MALRLEERGDCIAERGLAAVADMQGAGRVGGDEFHLHRLAAARARPAVARPLLQHARDDAEARAGLEAEVDEARAGDFRTLERIAGDRCGELLRKLARLAAKLLPELECDVGRKIAVIRLLRPLEQDRRGRVRRRHFCQRRAQGCFDLRLGIACH